MKPPKWLFVKPQCFTMTLYRLLLVPHKGDLAKPHIRKVPGRGFTDPSIYRQALCREAPYWVSLSGVSGVIYPGNSMNCQETQRN